MKNQDLIDLCECYEPMEYLPKEIFQAWKRENEPVSEQYYGTEPDGEMFFYIGNTRIKVSEHFNDNGKPLEDLLEDLITFSDKNSENS